MQKASDEKIKLGRRFAFVAAGILVVLSVVAGTLLLNRSKSEPQQQRVVELGKALDFEVVDTPEAQQQGLSGRENLAEDSAMLFDFGRPGQRCIWMKDMQFSIDIIWLDASQKVLRVSSDVAPETYPETFCADAAKYVVEMNAGKAKSLGLTIGSVASLEQ